MDATAAYTEFLDKIAVDPGVVRVPPADDGVLRRYHRGLNRCCDIAADVAAPRREEDFAPRLRLPELTSAYAEYFAPARMRICELGDYRSTRLSFLDLMRDESTGTTKTFASLAMVSRAVEHVRTTQQNVLIVCTTSGNKGTAIRSAVERACTLGLVRPEQLRIMMLVPARSAGKLRSSTLWRDPELRRLNPVVLYDGDDPAGVKRIGKAFHDECAPALRARRDMRVWYSLDLDNYRTADAARAFFEFEHFRKEVEGPPKPIHVHSVSSAFGLIGHRFGRSALESLGICSKENAPGYFLVQHLGTPDMVLHQRYGSFDRARAPKYSFDQRTGKYRQEDSAHFPRVTDSPEEVLDPTFYTRQPATSPFVSEMIGTYGGGGIVVSKHECVERYGVVRELLATTGITLPPNHEDIGEWSVVMALTGVMNAIDRGLLPPESHAIVHGSGFYTRTLEGLPRGELNTITDRDPPSGLIALVE